MRPAFSVVFLTTLIGAGQGLFLALFAVQLAGRAGSLGMPQAIFFVAGAVLSLALCAAGLVASFFHLGRPERAWRTAAMWRTSWLSREVIALPAFMAVVAGWGYAHYTGAQVPALMLGFVGIAACIALFYCTAMIYACVRFLQEWASGWTFANFLLMGCASGATLAAVLAMAFASHLILTVASAAVFLTMLAAMGRLASLARNRALRPLSTLQSATGLNHPQVRQISQGFTGDSFNTLEFFHGKTPAGMRRIRFTFLALAFVAPLALVPLGARAHSVGLLAVAFAVQYAGLVAERWYFLADSNHPQNLYYQNIS